MIIPLHPSIPMFGKAFASFGNSTFRPLSLNPLLAYEAESSMVAPFERPTLDLDPSNPSSLDPITATRAGVATYTDTDGVIQSADPNTVRVDYVDGVPMILVEPSATNLIPSTDFTSQGSASVVSGIDAPDGSNNAWRVSDIQLTIGDRAFSQAASISPSTEYTGSLYVRGTAGETISVYAKRQGGTYVGSQFVQVLLTGEWQRVKDLTLTTLADNTAVKVFVTNNGASDTADVVDVWGAQLEEGPVATSYIPTSGSTVTRNADDLVIEGSDFTDFYNQSEGTVYAEFSSKSDVDTALAEFRLNSSNRIVTGYIAPNTPWVGLVNTFNGSVDCALTAHSAPLDGTIMRGGFSYKQNNYKSSINGASELSDTSVSVPVNIDKVKIGQQSSKQLNGHIKRLIYWPYHSDDL